MPTAPSNFDATAIDGSTIRLTWNNEDFYNFINIYVNSGGGWGLHDTINGGLESEDFLATTNITYSFYVTGEDLATGESSPSREDSATCYSDSPSVETITFTDTVSKDDPVRGDALGEQITFTDIVTEPATFKDELTEGITFTDFVRDSQSISLEWKYFLADSAGEVYEYSDKFKGDAGLPISASWESKQTDFGDQDRGVADKAKYINYVRLYYEDKTASTTVSFSISNDGGVTWVTKTKSIGTGDGKSKAVDFWFRKTGHHFKFKIEHGSTDKEFLWAGFHVDVEILKGDWFLVS
jgi:hypothetical protein